MSKKEFDWPLGNRNSQTRELDGTEVSGKREPRGDKWELATRLKTGKWDVESEDE